MWRGFGLGFIIFLAGLQGISIDYYKAARIHGANDWQIFKNITVLMEHIYIFF